ncbi:hypothetical protein ABT187_38595 [Streptomyces sp. NPDC001817]|uniref:hypothetical protein n=1 Tax=Streptomyces sp. NPDC001817 TaxID=3154398 RepID=UPI0033339E5C
MVGIAVVVGVTGVPLADLVSGGERAYAAAGVGRAAAGAEGASGVASADGSVVMGPNVSGVVDERTGRLGVSVALASLAGRGVGGGGGVSLAASWDQGLLTSASEADRFGLGAGWSLGTAFVEVGEGDKRSRLFTDAGGSFEIAGDEDRRSGRAGESGLLRYPLKDIVFAQETGKLPAREGVKEREYAFTLVAADGGRQWFSAQGDLLAVADRFGNRTDYVWGAGHTLTGVVDGYGQEVSLGWVDREDGQGREFVVKGPERADGEVPVTRLVPGGDGWLERVIDPAGEETRFAAAAGPGGRGTVLGQVISAQGAVTDITYGEPAPGVVAVESVRVSGKDGTRLARELTLDMNPSGNGQRNFTGTGADGVQPDPDGYSLFDSGADDYTYETVLSDGRSSVRSVFNRAHLLKKQTSQVSGMGTVGRAEYAYPGEDGQGRPPAADDLPANYAQASRTVSTVVDPTDASRSRPVTSLAEHDERGRPVKTVQQAGSDVETVTETVYDDGPVGESGHYGLPVKTTVTGKDGTRSETVFELTGKDDIEGVADATGMAVRSSTSFAPDSKGDLTARTVLSTTVDARGETVGQKITWAQGARPEGHEGPDAYETRAGYEIRPGAKGGLVREDTTVTVMGRDEDNLVSSTVSDLSGDLALEDTDPEGRRSVNSYDAAGRIVRAVHLQGVQGAEQVGTVEYVSPTKVVVTGPDGRRTVTEADALGRTVKVSDNVRDGKIIEGDGGDGARVLQTVDYARALDDDRPRVLTTDAAGLVTETAVDKSGTVSDTKTADGTIQRTVADLVANTTGSGTLATGSDTQAGSGLKDARAVAGRKADDAGRIVEAHTAFADTALPAPPKTSTAYDGLGRVEQATAADLVTTPAYGTGGAQTGAAMRPVEDSPYRGRRFTADSSLDLSGGSVHKVLTQGEGEDAESRAGTRNVLDLAGRVRVQVDQLGNTTTLVHTKDGQIVSSITRTPGKNGGEGTLVSKTVNTFDKATGRLVSSTVTNGEGTSITRSMHHDRLGRITEVWEGTVQDGRDKTDQYTKSVIGYGYDADGNTTKVTYPDGTTLTQAFDQAGRLVKATDGAGAVTDYTYHPQTGRLQMAVQAAKDGTELASAAYTYDTLGRLETVKHGNRTTTAYEYFDNDQPRTQTLTRDDGGEVLARTAYTYNSHGNLASRTDTRPGVKDDGTTDTDAGNVTTHTVHTYDAYDRLTRTVLHDGDSTEGKLVKQTDYTINASGDVTHTKTTGADGKTSETVTTVDAAGRRTAVTTNDVKTEQTWDPAGNLTGDRHGNTLTYNPDNKPTTITPGQEGQARVEVAVAYWADGSRRTATTKTPDGTEQSTTYHYTPTGTLANDTTTGLTASYLTTPHGREHRTLTHDGKPAPTGETGGTGYLMADRRGNTLALVDHDATVTTSYFYEDYGRPTAHHGHPLTPNPDTDRAHTNPIQYGGEHTNPWDHTQYTPARTYTPDGYFTTRDTYQLHNRHQAFNTNPSEYTDPSGNISRKVKRAAAAAGYLGAAGMGATALAGAITGTLDETQATGLTAGAAGSLGIGITAHAKSRIKPSGGHKEPETPPDNKPGHGIHNKTSPPNQEAHEAASLSVAGNEPPGANSGTVSVAEFAENPEAGHSGREVESGGKGTFGQSRQTPLTGKLHPYDQNGFILSYTYDENNEFAAAAGILKTAYEFNGDGLARDSLGALVKMIPPGTRFDGKKVDLKKHNFYNEASKQPFLHHNLIVQSMVRLGIHDV